MKDSWVRAALLRDRRSQTQGMVVRLFNRLSLGSSVLLLGLAHCATAVQEDEPRGTPRTPSGGAGGAASGGQSGEARPVTGGQPAFTGGTAPTGGRTATGGGSPTGGRASTGGRTSGGYAPSGGRPPSGGFDGGGSAAAPPTGGSAGSAEPQGGASTGGSPSSGTGGSTPVDPCADGKHSAGETDVDCGGPICGPCNEGDSCQSDDDCAGGQCRAQVCVPDHCGDGYASGDESDADCGGSCQVCALGKACAADADCENRHCNGGTCAEPGHCAYGWRDEACGETCLERTQSDQRACELVLDCYVENDCGPTTCTGADQACGNNQLQMGGAPYPYANAVYDCLCN